MIPFLPLIGVAVVVAVIVKSKKNEDTNLNGFDVDGYYFDFVPKEKKAITGRIKDISKLRKIVQNFLLKNVKGATILNQNTNYNIIINDNAIGKWFSKPIGENKLRALTAIEDIIKVGIKIREEKGKTKDIKKVHYFVSIVSVNKATYPFLFQVHELEKSETFVYYVSMDSRTKKRPSKVLNGLLPIYYRGLLVDTEDVEIDSANIK